MIWLIGNKGMLGSEIEVQLMKETLSYVATDREVDITDLSILEDFVKNKKIDWIINCSAYTAVDRAENDIELCTKINALGPANLAKIAQKTGAKLVHFSTDYVFDGSSETPYQPSDEPNPQSIYGKTKLEGERNIQAATDAYFIIRIAWLYGQYGPNFVKTMLRLFSERDELKVVSDQIGAPTYALQLAKNVVSLIRSENVEYGVYHYSDKGRISWYDFALAIRQIVEENGILHNKPHIIPVPTSEYPTAAKRPAFSLLDSQLTRQKLGFEVKDWKENLKHYLDTSSGY